MTTNNWRVITGGPCSGKTTLLKRLEKKGFHVVYEAARIFIDQEMKKGRTLEQIRNNELSFQREILEMKIRLEKKLPKKEIIFFERGIPDSIAYYKLCGSSKNSYLEKAVHKSFYRKVFLLERLDYKKDYARTEDEKQAKKLELLLEETYRKLRFPMLKVPKMTIDERLKFILNNL